MSKRFQTSAHLYTILISKQTYLRPFNTNKDRIKQYKKEIKIMSFDDLKDSFNPEWIGLKGSPTNVYQSFTKQAKGAGEKFEDLSAEEAVKLIIERLDAKHII